MRKCTLANLDKLFAAIAENADLYLPVNDENGAASYKKWEEGTQMSDALNTVKSPKDFFFPQSEDLMTFKTEGKNIEITDIREESKDFVVFGVRACDVRSFDILDRVFITDPQDSYYASKREKGVIVSMACTRPTETCFCAAFDIDAAAPKGDVTTWKTEADLYLQANTEKGEALTALVQDLFTEGGEEEVAAQKETTAAIIDKLPYSNLDLSRFKPENLNELFNASEWEEMSEACLGCGTCTFVCPTCQCFDIRDFKTNEGVLRYRCWDSCMYSDFTLMAHGNSRTTQMQRFRQRFMHKLVYYPSQNDGLYSCVGCGRCVNKCPQNLNIVKVIKTLGGKNND